MCMRISCKKSLETDKGVIGGDWVSYREMNAFPPLDVQLSSYSLTGHIVSLGINFHTAIPYSSSASSSSSSSSCPVLLLILSALSPTYVLPLKTVSHFGQPLFLVLFPL
jgi:hypothetical protein